MGGHGDNIDKSQLAVNQVHSIIIYSSLLRPDCKDRGKKF